MKDDFKLSLTDFYPSGFHALYSISITEKDRCPWWVGIANVLSWPVQMILLPWRKQFSILWIYRKKRK